MSYLEPSREYKKTCYIKGYLIPDISRCNEIDYLVDQYDCKRIYYDGCFVDLYGSKSDVLAFEEYAVDMNLIMLDSLDSEIEYF